MSFHRYLHLLAFCFIISFPSITDAQASVQNFWSDYPSCEEACHESVFTSQQCSLENSCGCSGDCLCLADSCLCETNSWLIAVAQCIGKSCGASDVTTAASIVQSACNGKGFALAVGSAALVRYGMAAIPPPAGVMTTNAVPAAGTTRTTQQQVVTVTNTPAVSTPQTSTTSASSQEPSSPTTFAPESNSSTTPAPSTAATTPSTTISSQTSSSASATSTQPSSGSPSSSSPSSDVLTGIIVPSVLCGVTIIAGFIFWIVKRETATRWFMNACCCCCLGYQYKVDNGIPLRDLRGAP